jgi:hypothetical protein
MEILIEDFHEHNHEAKPKQALGLLGVLAGLKDRFYTFEEFPFLKREALPQGVLARAMQTSAAETESFAFKLKGKELEGLLLDLRDATDQKEIERGCAILEIRFSARILKLLTILFQYNYMSPGLTAALFRLGRKIGEKERYTAVEAFARHLGQAESKFSALCTIIETHDNDISKAFAALSIIEESPFASEAAYRYLRETSLEGYKANLKWMVRTIESKSAEELQPFLTKYLSSLDVSQYHDGVNLAILKKLGQPNLSPDWADYEKPLKDKFTQWYFLSRLKKHTFSMPKKYKVLSKYYKQVRSSLEMPEENLMIIDFGDIVIADIADRPYSFFYEKDVFDKEMEAWEKSREQEEALWDETEDERPAPYLPTFLRMDRGVYTARDFIIEEIEEPCVKLSYEGIDVLYINEMLDIKIGLAPDLRRKQLAKLKNRKKASYKQ